MRNETNPVLVSRVDDVHPKPYSEDEPPPTGHEEDTYKWRGNPEETFSDWKIEIVTKKTEEGRGANEDDNGDGEFKEDESDDEAELETVTTYHVHKCSLAFGTRKSEYFARLFRSATTGRYTEAECNTSRIELDPVAAGAFPALLDYIYAPERPLAIDTNTATALHSLGDYFEMRHLRWDAKQFCQRDISLANIDTYYEEGTRFQNQCIIDISAKFTGENLRSISPSAPIVKKAEPEFWVKVLKKSPGLKKVPKASSGVSSPSWITNIAARFLQISFRESSSRHWSKLMAEIGTLKIETMDKTTFNELTGVPMMQDIDAEAALVLCDLEDRLHAGEDPNLGGESGLQKRCAIAFSRKWEDFNPNQETIRMLERRKPAFLVELLTISLDNAGVALQIRQGTLLEKEAELERTKQELSRARVHESEQLKAFQQVQSSLHRCQNDLRIAKDSELKATQLIRNLFPLPPRAQCKLAYSPCEIPQEIAAHNCTLAGMTTVAYTGRLVDIGSSNSYPVFYYNTNT